VTAAAAGFVGKWLEREPWHRLLLLFQPPARRGLVELVEAVGHELRSAALASSDPRVSAGKLGWWAQDAERWPAGGSTHPLLQALAQRPDAIADAGALRDWVAAAGALAGDQAATDLEALLQPWLAFSRAQAAAFDLDDRSDGRTHALSLLAERLPQARLALSQGRLPVPLTSLAGHGGSRAALATDPGLRAHVLLDHCVELARGLAASAAGNRYRRGQAALARLRLQRSIRAGVRPGAESRALPPLRSAFTVWRASAGP
jgi:phytoene synthase